MGYTGWNLGPIFRDKAPATAEDDVPERPAPPSNDWAEGRWYCEDSGEPLTSMTDFEEQFVTRGPQVRNWAPLIVLIGVVICWIPFYVLSRVLT